MNPYYQLHKFRACSSHKSQNKKNTAQYQTKETSRHLSYPRCSQLPSKKVHNSPSSKTSSPGIKLTPTILVLPLSLGTNLLPSSASKLLHPPLSLVKRMQSVNPDLCAMECNRLNCTRLIASEMTSVVASEFKRGVFN